MMPLGDLAFGDDERSLMGDLGGGNTATGLCDPAWNEVSGVIPTVNSKEAFGAQLAYVQSLDPGSQEYQEALGGLEAMGENDEAAHDTWGSWK